MNGPRRLLHILVLACALIGAACGDRSSSRAGRYDDLYRGLCETRQAASDPDAATNVFFDKAHQRVHELASDTARTHRQDAGRLLEAKQAVETDLQRNGEELPTDLDTLLAATRRAIAATGARTPPPCDATR